MAEQWDCLEVTWLSDEIEHVFGLADLVDRLLKCCNSVFGRSWVKGRCSE